MKLKFVLAALLVLSISVSKAQFRKIPSEATNALRVKYPEAENVSWKSGLNTFKALFSRDKVNYTAEFNSKGEWIKTESRVTYDKLPLEVSDGLNKSLYSGWDHTELLYVEEKDKEPEYRIKVKKSSLGGKYLYFNQAGQLLRESIAL